MQIAFSKFFLSIRKLYIQGPIQTLLARWVGYIRFWTDIYMAGECVSRSKEVRLITYGKDTDNVEKCLSRRVLNRRR